MGRLSLSISATANIQASGELARFTFQSMGAPGTPAMRLEAVSLTDSAGKVLTAQIPPPLALLVRPAPQ
jgi:hypothetical protein